MVSTSTESRTTEVWLILTLIGVCVAAVAIADRDRTDPAMAKSSAEGRTVKQLAEEKPTVETSTVEQPAEEKTTVGTHHGDPHAEGLPENCKDFGEAPTESPTELVGAAAEINGVDVSVFQGEVPWRSLRAGGLRFVFIKATQGTDIVDPAFQRNWVGAKACGIPRSAYHLFDPSQGAGEQANDYLALVGDDFGELPAALDIELPYSPPFPSCEDYVAGILRWAKIVEDRTGRRPILYFQSWFFEDMLCASDALKAYPLWAAGDMSPTFERWPWRFWQHGAPGTWAGRQWDLDRFNGDEDSWQTLLLSSR